MTFLKPLLDCIGFFHTHFFPNEIHSKWLLLVFLPEYEAVAASLRFKSTGRTRQCLCIFTDHTVFVNAACDSDSFSSAVAGKKKKKKTKKTPQTLALEVFVWHHTIIVRA